jgi:hypothetical protein
MPGWVLWDLTVVRDRSGGKSLTNVLPKDKSLNYVRVFSGYCLYVHNESANSGGFAHHRGSRFMSLSAKEFVGEI